MAYTDVTTTVCKTVSDGIGQDRNNYGGDLSEGYYHNFDVPPNTSTCGDAYVSQAEIEITLNSFTNTLPPECIFFNFFGNVLSDPGVLPLSADCCQVHDEVFSGCSGFNGTQTLGTYTLDVANCPNTPLYPGGTIGVDLIAVMSFQGGCGSNETAITDGFISVDYEICVTITTSSPEEPTVDAGPDLIADCSPILIGGDPVGIDFDDTWTYEWSDGQSGNFDPDNGQVTITPNASGTYTVTVYGEGGCSATDEMEITLVPDPGCNTDICLGDTEIVDPADPCNCIVDEVQILGCTMPSSCNYNPAANCDDGSCMPQPDCNMDICAGNTEMVDPSDPCNCILDEVQILGCTDPTACNFDPTANCDDGSCMPQPVCNTDICLGDTEIIDPSDPCACVIDEVQVLGCTDPNSCNYLPSANCDDGSCLPMPDCNDDICLGDTFIPDPSNPCVCILDEEQMLGCTDPSACNYNPAANCDDGSCMETPTCNTDICAGDTEIIDPTDGCSCIVDEIQVLGCTDPNACNYNSMANCDDGSCMPQPNCNMDICLGDTEVVDPNDPCACIIDEIQILGCTNPNSDNYNPDANCDDGSCDCVPDGCTNPASCNYDPLATCDDGSCLPVPDCNTDICAGDTEIIDPNDPCACVVDIVQVVGCTDPNSCNYLPNANCDDGSCLPMPVCNTDICAGDTEIINPNDPCACVIDVVQVLGCTDPNSENYNPDANCDDGSCDCVPDGCTDPTACNYDPNATCNDGSCLPMPDCNTDICLGDTEIIDPNDACNCIIDEVQVLGCTNPNASNYNPDANCDDGSCDCVPDGCTDPNACNFDPSATCDDGSCLPMPNCNTDICIGDTEIIDPNDPCSCIVDEVQAFGCTDPTSCNYDPLANCDDGSCLPVPACNTDICLGDTEIIDPNDPCACIIDEIQVLGCTDPASCNYDPDANCDDGSCISNEDPGTCNTDCLLGDVEVWNEITCMCDVDIVSLLGCTDPTANNYNPNANCEDGSCMYDCPAVAEAGPVLELPCLEAMISLDGTGSSEGSNFSYSWSTNTGNIIGGEMSLFPVVNTPGIYYLLVTDTDLDCSVLDSVEVILGMDGVTGIQFETASPLCAGDANGTIFISMVEGGLSPYTFSLSNGETNNTGDFQSLIAADYEITVTDINGCSYSTMIEVLPTPPLSLMANLLEIEGEIGETYDIDLSTNIDVTNIQSVTWSPQTWMDCQDCLSQIVSPTMSGQIEVILTDIFGCETSLILNVTIDTNNDVYLGNVFSPTEGSQSFFVQSGSGVAEVKSFAIYDRWGNQVFANENFPTNDPNQGWDGTVNGADATSGVYVYRIVLEDIAGIEQMLIGDVTLIR